MRLITELHVAADGPAVELGSSKILAASIIFRELTTNAVKYGAPSVPDGEVIVTWLLEEGPVVQPPTFKSTSPRVTYRL